MPRSRRGVTLIEMVVVLAVLVILATFTIQRYGSWSDEAARNSAVVMSKSLMQAMKAYKLDNESAYPPDGPLTPLAGYIDHLTGIVNTHFTSALITTCDGATGIMGIVKDMEAPYCIFYAAKSPSSSAYKVSDTPHCRWASAGACPCDASDAPDWQSCEKADL